MELSLRGAVRDEAIPGGGQRLLRSARNDISTLCQVMEGLSHVLSSPAADIWPRALDGGR